MKLLKSKLTNFKGQESFTFTPDGNDTSIFGKNAAGKTTCADAQSYLFAGTNSKGDKTFGIKRTDNGKHIPEIECSVENTYMLDDGRQIKLKKEHKEVYAKVRGVKSPKPTSHKTLYYIDDNPKAKSKKDYDAFLSEFADPETFNILTNPLYFSLNLHWQKRWDYLHDWCGGVTDWEVLKSDDELYELPDILNGKPSKLVYESLKAQITDLESKKAVITPKIEERASDALDGGKGIDALTNELTDAETVLFDHQKEYGRIESGGQMAEIDKQLALADAEIIKLRNKEAESDHEKGAGLLVLIDGLKATMSGLKRDVTAAESLKNTHSDGIEANKTARERLLERYREFNAMVFSAEESMKKCPNCKYILNADQLEGAEKEFNENKANLLAENKKMGMDLKKATEILADSVAISTKQIADLAEQIKTKNKELVALQDKYDDRGEIKPSDEIVKAHDARVLLNDQKESIANDNCPALTVAGAAIDSARETVKEINAKIAACNSSSKNDGRIDELLAEEKDLSAQIEALYVTKDLIDKFNNKKITILESKVAGLFKMARFKMFTDPLDGEIKPCCEVLGPDNVPFKKDLNDGHMRLVGIDIINTVSKKLNFCPPIFIDQAGEITEDIETDAQLIRLVAYQSCCNKDCTCYSEAAPHNCGSEYFKADPGSDTPCEFKASKDLRVE